MATKGPRRPPQSPTEKRIAGFWQELLELDEVSLDDDFVQCGGNSLVATLLSHRLQKAFRYRPTLTEIFRSTVEEMARRCDEVVARQEA